MLRSLLGEFDALSVRNEVAELSVAKHRKTEPCFPLKRLAARLVLLDLEFDVVGDAAECGVNRNELLGVLFECAVCENLLNERQNFVHDGHRKRDEFAQLNAVGIELALRDAVQDDVAIIRVVLHELAQELCGHREAVDVLEKLVRFPIQLLGKVYCAVLKEGIGN